MPELPEVETTCCGIAPHILNKTIKKVVVRQPKLRWPIIPDLASKLTKHKVLDVNRRGKYILITLDNGCLIIHLGMSGRLCVVSLKEPIAKHSHLDIQIDTKILRYTDPRRFGCVMWTENEPMEHKLLVNLGVEPLTRAFTGKHIYELSIGKKQAVKQFVMDAKIVVGVGNIYANEALFQAKINPLTPAGKINLEQYKDLVIKIKKILKLAIKKGGTTLKDFLSSDGKPGYFSQSLQVYGRGGEDCVECGYTLEEIKLGQRTTVFCPNCQR